MDIEVLKELVKLFASVGDGAREAFIYYLCFEYISNFIISLVMFGTVIFAITKLYKVIQICSASHRLNRSAGYNGDWGMMELNNVCCFLEKEYRNRKNN